MGNVQIDSNVEMRPINTIRPYTRNPRKNAKTIELLMKLIPRVGFNVPIVVDEKGIIVKGHARFIAAIRLGMKEVPCITSHADEEAIKADRIADNRISEFSEWITYDLMNEINELDFDLSDLGLFKIGFEGVNSSEDLVEAFSDEEDDDEIEEEMTALERVISEPHYSVVCEKCGYHMIIPLAEVEGVDEI